MLLSALRIYQGVGMQAVRKRGVRAVMMAAGIGATLLVSAPSAQAWDDYYNAMHFYGTSQVSYQDAQDIAYADAVEWGYSQCHVESWQSYGSPVSYEVQLICWT
jgi:hypothetical protein